jgi:hypothetical protein
MIRFAKVILSAKLNGLALGLLTRSAPAAQPAAVSANLPLFFEANQGQAINPAQFFRLYKFWRPASFQLASSVKFAFICP